ncbi:uncharacterized protein RSE6_10545 [Rhynchosporium secalis]|uniref:VOC domain-containing protein n=1 Tax=Rhynchosporium secalis TaxID=38038 RepID=A0A1E1MKS0_RHYSE|nr:uncharacterized protein RSE6_10545 [Rhynchosporium secalis]
MCLRGRVPMSLFPDSSSSAQNSSKQESPKLSCTSINWSTASSHLTPLGQPTSLHHSAHHPTITIPIDHISLPVKDFEASKAFYTEILKPLSYGVFMEFPGNAVGYAPAGKRSDFFTGSSKAQVDEFHANALKAGARCNGPPGFRPQYHEKYYGAFILDPDGNNIECVFFDL